MVIKMNKLNNLQNLLKNNNIQAYIVPTSDYHNSEYISDHFKARAIISKFTGSAGTLLVTQNSALLWTDGRYHIQAQKELDGTGIILMKQGLPNVPTITQYINQNFKANDVLAFDGKLMSANHVINMSTELKDGITINSNLDFIDQIWEDRPKMPFSVLFKLDKYFCGKEFIEKLNEVKSIMNNKGANTFILSKLEDQAWLYNLRGNDVKHTPVFLANTVITNDSTILFIDQNKIDLTVEKYLNDNDIIIRPYFDFYEYIKGIKNKNILLDINNINYEIYKSVVDNNI
jgi:Xaa-Pro aminopeptidase